MTMGTLFRKGQAWSSLPVRASDQNTVFNGETLEAIYGSSLADVADRLNMDAVLPLSSDLSDPPKTDST